MKPVAIWFLSRSLLILALALGVGMCAPEESAIAAVVSR
jgi:hypothetical protein